MTPPGLDRIVKNAAPLAEEAVPDAWPGRSEQLRELLDIVNEGMRRPLALHAWLFGPTGAGKTMAARLLMARAEEKGIRTAYVNCWSNQSFFAALETIFQELRALVGDQRDVSFKYERLLRIARERPLLVVLDEVDQMFPRERNALLYNVPRLNHVGVVCLSQSRQAYRNCPAKCIWLTAA